MQASKGAVPSLPFENSLCIFAVDALQRGGRQLQAVVPPPYAAGYEFIGRLQQTPVMGISKGWIYAAMPVGGALMILYSLPSLWRSVRELCE